MKLFVASKLAVRAAEWANEQGLKISEWSWLHARFDDEPEDRLRGLHNFVVVELDQLPPVVSQQIRLQRGIVLRWQ